MSQTKPGLKGSELADASGVSAATIKHYLREGLLGENGEIVRTSRKMVRELIGAMPSKLLLAGLQRRT